MSGDEGRVDPWGAGAEPDEDGRGAVEAAPPRTGPVAENRRVGGADIRREPEGGDEITFERIRERAYDLWERNHRPEGLEIQFWLVAERELRAERERRLADRDGAPDGEA